MRLLWLPDVLEAAGVTVHTYDGWESRGSASWGPDTSNAAYRYPLQGVVCHATAGSRKSTTAGETRTLWVTGSVSAPAPISQLYLSRSGEWTVGASGRCNHVLVGHKGPHKGYGNYQLIGVEAQNDNRGEPWPDEMLEAYELGCAAICDHMGWDASVVVAHHEHQHGKTDPLGINMSTFRRAVADLIEGGLVANLDELAEKTADKTVSKLLGAQVTSRVTDRTVKLGHTVWGGTYRNTYRILDEVRAGFAAVLAKTYGDDVAATVIAALEQHHSGQLEQLEQQLEQLEQVVGMLEGLAELVRSVQSGEQDAREVVDEISRRLAAAQPAKQAG